MRLVFVFLLLVSGCLNTGCSVDLKSPADAFGVGSQKDRTLRLRKNWFGASADIPLTDFKGTGKVVYDPQTGAFTADVTVDQNWSSTMTIENARIKENQELYLGLITAQQEIYDRRTDAWKEVGLHGIDAAAQAIGLLTKMPDGGEAASGLIGELMSSVGPQMLPTLLSALTNR